MALSLMILAFHIVEAIEAFLQVRADSNVLSDESNDVEMLEPQEPTMRAGKFPAQGNGMLAF